MLQSRSDSVRLRKIGKKNACVNLSILIILFTTSSILKAQVQFKPLINYSFQFLFQRLSFPKSHLRMISLELAMFPVVGSGGLRSIGQVFPNYIVCTKKKNRQKSLGHSIPFTTECFLLECRKKIFLLCMLEEGLTGKTTQ